MKELWATLAEAAGSLHSDKLKALAKNVSGLSSHLGFSAIVEDFGGRQMAEMERAWVAHPEVTPNEIAAALNFAACSKEAKPNESIELVWTGPNSSLVPSRDTEQVLLQVIDSALEKLFLVSYVFTGVNRIVDALSRAKERGVSISILMESSKGGATRIGKKVPGLRILNWIPSNMEMFEGRNFKPSVHAKCAVADSAIAFITSANLTNYAMEFNMELGVLVRNGDLPKQLNDHLEALVTTNEINPE
jgi:cardiolipin synthase A/B